MDGLKQYIGIKLEIILKYLEKGDEVGATMVAISQLKNCPQIKKSNILSMKLRATGNKEFANENFHASLYLYNAAIMNAPKGSLALKIAYANRAEVFFELKKFDACLKDIDTCEILGYPADKLPKLLEQKNHCLKKVENNDETIKKSIYKAASDFFLEDEFSSLKEESSLIEVSVEGLTHLESSKNFEIGDIVMTNTPMVTVPARINSLVCCWYCLRYYENLIPCPNCCNVLFCNLDCLQKCYTEYHHIECAIMHMYFDCYEKYWSAFRLAIKERIRAGSWKKFIENTNEAKTRKHCQNRLSVLLDRTLVIAVMIRSVNTKTNFFSDSALTNQVCIESFVQCIISFDYLVGIETLMHHTVPVGKSVGGHSISLTTLDSKLKHACNANLLPVLVNKKIYFIAKAPIAKGDILTLSNSAMYEFEWKKMRQAGLYRVHNFICDCTACANDWAFPKTMPSDLTGEELFALHCLQFCESSNPRKKLRLICQILKENYKKPCSFLYLASIRLFYEHILNYVSILENHYTSGDVALHQSIQRILGL